MRFKTAQLITILLVLCGVSTAWAASFNGKVVAYDPNSRKLIVENTTGQGRSTYILPPKLLISSGAKKLSDSALQAGVNVTVYTNANDVVTSLSIKAAASKPKDSVVDPPAAKPAPKSKPSKSSPRDETPPANEDADRPQPPARATPRGQLGNNLDPADWPSFDGAFRDNVSRETGLLQEWNADGPALAWTAQGAGEGFASIAVSGGKVFTYGNVGQNEVVSAFDLESGTVVWQSPTSSASRLDAGNGPRGTPTVDGEYVYALGGNGDLTCLETASGKRVWDKNILQEFGGQNITWGISESVLIDGDRLICTPGGTQGTLVALNKRTGALEWRCLVPGGVQAGYSSAIMAEVGGVKQYIQFTSKGVIGVRAETGDFLWGNDASANPTANCSSPLFADNHVFTASGYGKGGAMLRLSARGRQVAAEFGYHTTEMKNHHGGMVLLDGFVYGSNDPGVLVCLDVKTGRVKWQNRSVGKGSLTYADGHLYVRSENGPLALVAADPTKYQEHGRFDQPDRSGSPAWAHPVVAQGKLFLRDQDRVLAFDVKNR